MRENILDALTKEIGAADHAIILTHDIDFVLVQSVVLPKLRAIGGPRLTIFADAGCAQESFGRQHRLLSGLGSTYRVVPVDLGPYRRFHPKAWLLANRDRAVAAVGSGNLTFGGLSANREVWARGASDGEGANLIAALRAYLPQILANVPLSAVVADGVAAAFNPEFAWVGGLGEPAGVAMAPAARPLLDQIGDYVTGDVERVSVVTPFFDKEAAALAEIARRFQVPVTAYVQPSRAGLSKGAADRLPELVSIGTANCNAGEGDRAIHAKIFAFHRKDDVILAVGSANCSQAALTLGPEACNAEMVVIQTASLKDAAEFLAGVALDEVPPALPDQLADDDEQGKRGAFRILAARQKGDVVDVAFYSGAALADVEIESEDGRWPAMHFDRKAKTARFGPVPRLRKAVLFGVSDEGVKMWSDPCWVDDEASLSAPASLPRFLGGAQRWLSGRGGAPDEYADVLDLFRNYLRDPEAARGWGRSANATTAPAAYDPSTVFADGFGTNLSGASAAHAGLPSGMGDALSAIAGLFHFRHEAASSDPRDPPADGENEDDETPKAPTRRPELRSNSQRLRKAVHGMTEALTDAGYVRGRRPELLSAEIALAAIVLARGLSNGDLDLATYRATTETLWQALFFGARGGAAGAVVKRMELLPPEGQAAFIGAFASARLSAALVLWLLPVWRMAGPDSLWLRLSVAQLQRRAPWLFASAAPEVIQAEMRALAEQFAQAEASHEINGVWLRIIRAGAALQCFANLMGRTPASGLPNDGTTAVIAAGQVLWQASSLAVAMKTCKREAGAKAEVRLLGEDSVRKFRGDHLLPVNEVLAEHDAELPAGVGDVISQIVADYSAAIDGAA